MALSIAVILNAVVCSGLAVAWVRALVTARRRRKRETAPDFVPASWRCEDRQLLDRELIGLEEELVELEAGRPEREPAGR